MPHDSEDQAELDRLEAERLGAAEQSDLEDRARDLTQAIGAWIDFKIEASQGRKVYYDFGERQERAVREEILRALGGTVRPQYDD